jgi:hypothetical protein
LKKIEVEMKCLSCGKGNIQNAKFCKFCGAQLTVKHKTCANGHNYDAKLEQCPYCPRAEVTATITKAITSAKTLIDGNDDVTTDLREKQSAGKAQTRTVIDKKTVIVGIEKSIKGETSLKGNRLVGWLVSFDLDPDGKDFKIFEGRTKIGRNSANNIIIDKPEISDDHVLLLSRDSKIIIQDQLSANGTYLNGKKVDERKELKDNDVIKLGSISFKIKII